MSRPAHIRETSVQIAGQWRQQTLVRCPGCGGERTFGYVPPAKLARFLSDHGYRDGLDAKRCRCAICQAKPVLPAGQRPALTPQQKRAAFCAIAGVPRADGAPVKPARRVKSAAALPVSVLTVAKGGEAMAKHDHEDLISRSPLPSQVAEPLKAEPPRTATREDRRRIHDALEAAYDIKRGCYNLDGSDDKLARHLNVPRAWVAEVRNLAFGEDVNAHSLDAPAKFKELETKFRAQSERFLTLAQESEKMAAECQAAFARFGSVA